jgi:hypothetical protein
LDASSGELSCSLIASTDAGSVSGSGEPADHRE